MRRQDEVFESRRRDVEHKRQAVGEDVVLVGVAAAVQEDVDCAEVAQDCLFEVGGAGG